MRIGIALLVGLVLVVLVVRSSIDATDEGASSSSSAADSTSGPDDRAPRAPGTATSETRTLVAVPPIATMDERAELPPSSLRGRVVDPTGVPLPEASVTVSHSGSMHETRLVTDATGAYSIADLHAADAILQADLAGYAPTGTGRRAVNLVAGQELRVDDLVLARPIAIRGTVIDDAKVPIVGADVRLEVASRSYDGGTWELADHLSFETRTDASGRFAFDVAPERTWTLTTCDAGARVETRVDVLSMPSDVVVTLPILRTFTLDVVDADSGVAIEGFTARANFHGERAALDSASLAFEPTADMRRALLARRTAHGGVEFAARVDTALDLGALAPGYAFCDLPRLTPADQHVVARLKRSEIRALRVRVIGVDGSPLVGRGVSLFSRAEGGCGLQQDPHGFQVADRTTDAHGDVVFDVRSDGPFQAMLAHTPHPGARTPWIEWSASTSDVTHEIRVEADASITGQVVHDGQPIRARIELRVTRDDGWACVADAGPDGVFVTPALAPGRYRVSPRDADPELVASVAAEVELAAGTQRGLDVDLATFRCGVLAGTVRFNGEPAAGIAVSLPQSGGAITDRTGGFVFAGLPVGPAVVELRRAYEHAAVRAIDVVPHTITRLDLELTMARVRGRVQDAAKRSPLVEALVTLTPIDPAALPVDVDRFSSYSYSLESGPDGAWEVPALECRDYVLTVEPFVESSHASTRRLVRVQPDGAEILTLLDAPATLVVRTSVPTGADAIVEARRQDAPWSEPRVANRDEAGVVTLEGLEPGIWTITLWSVDDDDRRALVHDFGTATFAPGETRTLVPPR